MRRLANSVDSSELVGSIDAAHIGSGQFECKLAVNSVITAKIADEAVTTGKLADNSVTSAKIVNGTIVTRPCDNSILQQK